MSDGSFPGAVMHSPQAASAGGEVRPFVRRAAIFVLVGVMLYAGLYVAAERLVYQYAERNRFFAIRTTPPTRFDYAILGASHAAALGNADLNARLEAMTGGKVMNLSVVGGGVVVNQLVLDYFLTRHTASTFVYVVDSFAFYSRAWNEERLRDTRLFVRAPFDLKLGELLLRTPAGRPVALDYLSGFSKINNPDRFAPDIPGDERTRVTRIYRPVPQIDRQRIEYLYPARIDPDTTKGYLLQFESLIDDVRSRGARVIVIKPPIPGRVLQMIPGEARFDALLKAIVDRKCIPFHDFSTVGNDPRFFYDTDHLNYAGVLNFFERYLGEALAGASPSDCY